MIHPGVANTALYFQDAWYSKKYHIGQLVDEGSHLLRPVVPFKNPQELQSRLGTYLPTYLSICKKFLHALPYLSTTYPTNKLNKWFYLPTYPYLPTDHPSNKLCRAHPLPIVQTLYWLTPTAFYIVNFFTNVLLTCYYPDIVHHHHIMFCLFLSVLT